MNKKLVNLVAPFFSFIIIFCTSFPAIGEPNSVDAQFAKIKADFPKHPNRALQSWKALSAKLSKSGDESKRFSLALDFANEASELKLFADAEDSYEAIIAAAPHAECSGVADAARLKLFSTLVAHRISLGGKTSTESQATEQRIVESGSALLSKDPNCESTLKISREATTTQASLEKDFPIIPADLVLQTIDKAGTSLQAAGLASILAPLCTQMLHSQTGLDAVFRNLCPTVTASNSANAATTQTLVAVKGATTQVVTTQPTSGQAQSVGAVKVSSPGVPVSSGSQSSPAKTHMACAPGDQYNWGLCEEVPGAGPDQCSQANDPACGHYECNSGSTACALVYGPGQKGSCDPKDPKNDCTHLECNGDPNYPACVSKAGEGADAPGCTYDGVQTDGKSLCASKVCHKSINTQPNASNLYAFTCTEDVASQSNCSADKDCGVLACGQDGKCYINTSAPAGYTPCTSADTSACGKGVCSPAGTCVLDTTGTATGKSCYRSLDCGATHKACVSDPEESNTYGSCNEVLGAGPDTCTSDSACRHFACASGSCQQVAGPGPTCDPNAENTCTSHLQCRHKYDGSQSCVAVNGTGPDDKSCTDNSCVSHLGCQMGQCVQLDGAGQNNCTACLRSYCVQGVCQAVQGNFGNAFYLPCDPKSCGPTHDVCSNGKCVSVSGATQDECSFDGQCGHHVCGSDGFCHSVAGAGVDECHPEDSNYSGGYVHACGHRGCSGGVCTIVSGPGSNSCFYDDECTQVAVGNSSGGANSTSAVAVASEPMNPSSAIAVAVASSGFEFSAGVATFAAADSNAIAGIEADAVGGRSLTTNTFTENDIAARGWKVIDPDHDATQVKMKDAVTQLLGRNVVGADDWQKNREKLNAVPALSFVGSPKAETTVDLFEDLSCGMCKYTFKSMIEPALKDAVAKGTLRIVFREFPLGFRAQEVSLASAAKCAGEQGHYLDFIRARYAVAEENEDVMPFINTAPKALKLNAAKYKACIANPKTVATVRREFDLGEALGVNGTPTFFINGHRSEGARTYESFKELNQQILKSAR